MTTEEQFGEYRELFKARIFDIDKKMKELYDETYLLIPSMKQDIKSNFEQINKAVITLMTKASTVDGVLDLDMKHKIEAMKFVDIY